MTLTLASITSSITSFVGDHGVYAVLVLMAIDAVFPAGSELVMVYGGALAAGAFAGQHVLLFGDKVTSHAGAYLTIVVAGLVGYQIGALIGWGIGRFGGRPLIEQRGRWLHLGPERVARADAWFDKHGNMSVLLGRITPVVRSFVSIPAGVVEIPLAPYAVLTLIGNAIWCFALAGVGLAIGSSYRSFNSAFDYVSVAVVVVVVAGAAYLWWRRRTGTRATEPAA